jgi:aldehyde dehydrogenase family 7 protein A1
MNGRVIASERPGHSILEGEASGLRDNVHKNSHVSTVPNPLGVVAVLSAFNFPVAVYGWYGSIYFRNLMLLSSLD